MDSSQFQVSEISKLPQHSGVYFFYTADKQVIYVGKAKNLKSRVGQYFHSQVTSKRLHFLVTQIAYVRIVITQTESDALILENQMIKKHQPKYNVLLKDDKTYPYLCVTRDAFPRILITRHTRRKDCRYYGPYTNGYAVRKVLDLLQKLFKLRTCHNSYFNHRSRPCLLYQIKRCSGPCVDLISQDEYASDIQQALSLLKGKGSDVIQHYSQKMQLASDVENFERELRDNGITNLIYLGFASNMCIIGRRVGMFGMYQRGFSTYFVPESSAAVETGEGWNNGLFHEFTTSLIQHNFPGTISKSSILNSLSGN